MDLDFDKYCVVDGSPTTVLPSSRWQSKVHKKTVKGYQGSKNELFCSKDDFTEINFHRFRSVSCKTSRTPLEYNEARKRGSVYQSSKELRLMRKSDAVEGRKKIEISRSSANVLSLGILDSLCELDEDNSQVDQKRSSVMSLNSEFSATISSRPDIELQSHDPFDRSFCPVQVRGVPSDDYSEISVDSDNRDNHYREAAKRQPAPDQLFKFKPVILPANDGKILLETDPAVPLHKSLLAKLALPHSPSQSESDSSRVSSPKTRFGPVRKVLDPFVKSKSQRSPLSPLVEPTRKNANKLASIRRNRTLRKSLLHDFSNMGKSVEWESWSAKESYSQLVQSTPVHLRGLLKLDKKQALPVFEFSVKFPEDTFVAKTWEAEDGLNLVYTFHSVNERRKSNASGKGLKESNKVSSVVGQMQVSCYLCAESKVDGAFDNSIVSEFVLFDIGQQRKSVSSQGNSGCPTDVTKDPKISSEHSLQVSHNLDEVSVKPKVQGQPKLGHSDSSTCQPLAAAELHTYLQIGAIVVQVPYEKRESLKLKSGDKEIDQPFLNFIDSFDVEQRKERASNSSNAIKVNTVVPSGNHGQPTSESHCPSPLLDRWRFGGGCDCGGWDMACPIHVFSNLRVSEDDLLITNQHPLELFLQGKRDTTPALTLKLLEDGQYSVDFHAQLSSLQAFSVCVAVLHTMESSVRIKPEQNEQLLQSDSLRVFIEEEVKNLMNAVTEEGKCKENKKMQAVLPSFVVNPPFSPIARV